MKITEEMIERAQQSLLSSFGWVRDSHVRAALEAALTEDDTEWEYAAESNYGHDVAPTREEAEILAKNYRWSRIVRRRKAGPREPVPTEEGAGRG